MSAGSCAVVDVVARGSLATVATFSHGSRWEGDPDEEAFTLPTAIFTTRGRWRFRGRHGRVEACPPVVVLGHAGEAYRCGHDGRPEDTTFFVTVLGDYELPRRSSVPRHAALDRIAGALLGARSPLRVDALALTLLAELHELPEEAPRLDARRRLIVEDAQAQLARSPDRNWTLAELAALVHVSPFHLHRLFRAAVGRTPHEYLTELRVEHACALLREGWSVGETALAVGFRSRGHFARVFRAHVGVTPARYR